MKLDDYSAHPGEDSKGNESPFWGERVPEVKTDREVILIMMEAMMFLNQRADRMEKEIEHLAAKQRGMENSLMQFTGK